jgi:hypothetical protein
LFDTELILDLARTERLPTPLARAARTLVEENKNSGEHTTADEVVGAIEALFSLVGRLWVAEYLAAGAPDETANRMLYELVVANRRRLQCGAWIALGRMLRTTFLARGLTPVAQGLLSLDFGVISDDRHPVVRLSAYRNSFAHGSFQSAVEDIRAHRRLLSNLIGSLPFLDKQPFVLATSNGVLALRGQVEPVQLHNVQSGVDLPAMHPCLLGADGRVVDLWPLAVGRDEKGMVGLCWPTKKDVGPKEIVKHTHFVSWFVRFQRELQGHVEAMATCLGAPTNWPQATDAVSAFALRRGLLLLETAPGAERAGVLATWADEATVRWKVVPHELMGSGLVFVKALLRASERALGLDDGSLPCREPESWRTAMMDVAARVEAAGVVIRVALDDLHLGDAPARPDEPSIQEVWRAMAGGPFLALAGLVRQWSQRPLPCDGKVSFGWSECTDRRVLADFFLQRVVSDLHRDVMAALEVAAGPVDLFELSDAIEHIRGGGRVFEPAVERAVWDLAPVLLIGKAMRTREVATQSVRTFSLLDPYRIRAALEVT